MRTPEIIGYRGHRFGETVRLTPSQRDRLITLFGETRESARDILGGREAVQRIDLDDLGPVVVKQYARGGVIRHVNREIHLRMGRPRSAREMAWLQNVRRLGIRAPHPVAWADDGARLFYRCWLITRTIPETVTLAQVALQNPPRAAAAFPDVCRQMALLVANRVHHTDMHPGNVLLDNRAKVFFLDFDKAARHHGSLRRLAAKYRRRWHRAVIKYGLPRELDLFLAEDLGRRWKV
jgi:3-deoxy-D-manno-octulosonic acid kinase